MARIKRGKNIRVPEAALHLVEALREKLGRVSHIQGVRVDPIVKLGDGAVIAWALAMTNHLMNPKFSVIDIEDFSERFMEKLDAVLADSENCTKDELVARIRMAVAASSAVGGYNTDDALRGSTPEGGQPS